MHTATIGKAYNAAVEEYRKALAELEEKGFFGRYIARYDKNGWGYNRILSYLYVHTNELEDKSTNVDKIACNLRRGCRGEDYEAGKNIKVNARLGEFGAALRESLGHALPLPHNRVNSCKKPNPCSMCSFLAFDKDPGTGRYDLFLRREFREALEKHFGKEKLKEVLSKWRKKYRPKRRVPRRKQETP